MDGGGGADCISFARLLNFSELMTVSVMFVSSVAASDILLSVPSTSRVLLLLLSIGGDES